MKTSSLFNALAYEHVFVDAIRPCVTNPRWPYKTASHLVADVTWTDLLHDTAKALGLKREWFQDSSIPHYDLNGAKWNKAMAAGLRLVEDRELVTRIIRPSRWLRNHFRPFTMVTDDHLLVPQSIIAWMGSNGLLYFAEVRGLLSAMSIDITDFDRKYRTSNIYIERVKFVCQDPAAFKSNSRLLLSSLNSSSEIVSSLKA